MVLSNLSATYYLCNNPSFRRNLNDKKIILGTSFFNTRAVLFKNTKLINKYFSTSYKNSNDQKFLNFEYISSVIFRVLPNIKWKTSDYSFYYNDKTIKNYFSRVYPINEYKSITKYFINAGFDMSLYEKVKIDMLDYKTKLLESASTAQEVYTNKSGFLWMCKVKRKHVDFLNHKINDELLCFQKGKDKMHFYNCKPTIDDILLQVNKKASTGMPAPWIRKRDTMLKLKEFLIKFYNRELHFKDFNFSPSATLFRISVRGSGVKFRVVHCVQSLMAIIESYYRMFFCNMLPADYETIFLGKMQVDISKLSKKYSSYYIHSVDHVKWDIYRQPILSVMFFSILENSLPLSNYEIKILRILRNIYLTMPSFHTSLPTLHRWIGTVSGSSFTTLDNSICNWLCVYIILFDMYGEDELNKMKIKVVVHGDDLLIFSKVEINMDKFFQYLKDKFNMTAKMECKVSKPKKPEFFFLGSFWKNHKPRRSEKLLVALVLFGSTNFDRMSETMLLQSRFFEIFGNSSQCQFFWDKLCSKNSIKPPDIHKRLYHFRDIRRDFEGGPKRLDLGEAININGALSHQKTSRGYFYKRIWNYDEMKNLWKLR